MKLTNKKLIAIWNSLEQAKPAKPLPREFVFWRNKVKLSLEDHIESLEKARRVDEEHWKPEIDARRKDILEVQKKYAMKDEHDKPLMTPNGEYMLSDVKSYEDEAEEIIKKVYTDLYNEEERVKKEYEVMLNNVIEIDLLKLSQEKLPANFDSLEGSTGLFILVE